MFNYQQSDMNFITKQSKLTKEEWTNIEISCSEEEKRILSLIHDGYSNVNIIRNHTSGINISSTSINIRDNTCTSIKIWNHV